MELCALEARTVLHHRYEILAPIGRGGFSILYKAFDRELGAAVAIKEYFPSADAERIPYTKEVLSRNGESAERFRTGLQFFREEAHRMAALNGLHNTVNVLGFFDENNTAYIVMELLEGISLSDYLRGLPDGRFSDVEDAKQIIYSVAVALQYAHSKKILHRDVSPDNIFLCHDGRVKLIDFGAAREMTDTDGGSVVVKSGCTPPEQYRKNGKQGPRTDLYALGATFYRMLTGIYPEAAPDRTEDSECLPPSAINRATPAYIDALILRCLAYDPTLRPSGAAEVADILRKEKVMRSPAALRADKKLLGRLSCGMFAACLILFVIIGLVLFKKSETLYTVRIAACEIRVEIPTYFSSEEGLAALLDDFRSICPQIGVKFVAEGSAAEGAEVILFRGDPTECVSLDEIRRVKESADSHSVTLAYDAEVVYLNLEKAFYLGITPEQLRSAEEIPVAYFADDYKTFSESTNDRCVFRGSVALLGQIQRDLPGMYAILRQEGEFSPVRMAVASGLSENLQIAAMRFLLYLMSERAQEILFIHHEGLIPAEENQNRAFFALYDEILPLGE